MESPYRFNPMPLGTHTLLVAEIPEHSRVLEIGAATGYMGGWLAAEKNCAVWGVEPVKEWHDEALGRGYEKILNMDADAFLRSEMPPEKFDRLLLADVLEHMPDPAQTLAKLRACLKPDGRTVISLPNVAHYGVRFALMRGKWDMADAGIMDRTHLHFYTEKTAKEMIEGAGFRIEKIRGTDGHLEAKKLFGIPYGKTLLETWPNLFAPQFIFVAKPAEK